MPERLDLRPQRPDLMSQRPDLRSEGPDGGTNKQTNGRTKVPLCSITKIMKFHEKLVYYLNILSYCGY